MIAAGLLIASLVGATPYVRMQGQSEDGAPSHCLWWPAGELTLTVNSEGVDEIPGTDELDAVSRSIDTWRQAMASCGNLTVSEAPATTSRDIGYDQTPGAANHNMVLFRRRGACSDVVADSDPCWDDSKFACAAAHDCWPHARNALAITTNIYDVKSGRIFDADVELNAAGFRFTGGTQTSPTCVPEEYDACVYWDIENTMAHELGHVFGLDHAPLSDLQSTMYRTSDIGETDKRDLDPATLQFVCEVYPAGSYSRDCIREPLDPELGPASCAATGGSSGGGGWLALIAAASALVLGARRRRS